MLYGDSCTHLDKTDTPKFKGSIFEKAAKKIYENKGFKTEDLASDEAAAVINETYRILKNAISSSITHEVPEEVIYALENNAFTFSGFKTFHSLKEVGLSLIGKDGKIVQFNDFTQQVQAINDKYNRNYLYAEYNHAIGSSMMAAKWTEFEKAGDRYNLQYRTAGDDRVREEHALLNGTTLPASDPFWDRFLPPNGWNCRCTVVQVRKNKYPTSDSELANKRGEECTKGAKNAIFRYNSGKTLKLFPPKHPYYKAPEDAKRIINEALTAKRIKDMMDELPDNLTDTEKTAISKHNIRLEKALGIPKGKSMDFEKANKGKENPNFSKDISYQVNCQTCTVTHMLRRLGFDVKAKPNIRNSAFTEMERQGMTWKQRFKNPDGSDVDYDFTSGWARRKGYRSMTTNRLQEYFAEKMNHDGIYEIYCAWKTGNAHVFCAEVKNGKVRYFDPQTGNENAVRYIQRMKAGMVGIIRIDNKLVNPKLKNLFITE